MSHYIKVKTKFKDAAALVQALRELFPNSTIEELAEPKAIRRYDKKPGHPCSIIVRKSKGTTPVTDTAGKYIEPFYGDLGFAREEDGTFAQHADDLDLGRGSGSTLAQCYARIVTIKQAKLSGFTVQEVKAPNGTITLNLSKWS